MEIKKFKFTENVKLPNGETMTIHGDSKVQLILKSKKIIRDWKLNNKKVCRWTEREEAVLKHPVT